MGICKLKWLRMTSGLTQFELGQKLGVSEKLVSAWETCRADPGTDTCFRIAKIFNTDVSELWPDRFSPLPKQVNTPGYTGE